MARGGADVTGIDLADKSLKVARLHGLESGVKVEYRKVPVEELAAEQPGQYDVVTCMEMLEHVPDPGAIIEACKRLLKPGGHLFLSTINRTAAAFAVAIVGAEYVARLLPKGTHHYQEFIKPAELARWLREADMQLPHRHQLPGLRGQAGMTTAGFPRAVLFDLDGTLLDSAPDFVATCDAMLAELADVRAVLDRAERAIADGDNAVLLALLETAAQARRNWRKE
ncbi:hypothetical protein G6F59_013764 [Rhizopus arrhizus]|nr:hypothetical protein G6F59_013764 [Rhizopus arrhizus]